MIGILILFAFVKFLCCEEIDIVEPCIPQTFLKNYNSSKNNYKLTTIPESKVANAIISTLYQNSNDELSSETVFVLEADETKSFLFCNSNNSLDSSTNANSKNNNNNN